MSTENTTGPGPQDGDGPEYQPAGEDNIAERLATQP